MCVSIRLAPLSCHEKHAERKIRSEQDLEESSISNEHTKEPSHLPEPDLSHEATTWHLQKSAECPQYPLSRVPRLRGHSACAGDHPCLLEFRILMCCGGGEGVTQPSLLRCATWFYVHLTQVSLLKNCSLH